MKSFFMATAAMALLAGSVWADPAEIIKQKALGIRDMNNQRQGISAPPPYSAPAPPPAPAAPSGPSADQQALIDRLQRDLTTVKNSAAASPELTTGLETDIAALVKGAMKPTKAELTKLATDLSAALPGKNFTATDLAQLARDINISVNCAVLTPARAQTFVSGAQIVLKNDAVTDVNVQAITSDLQGIVNEIQKSKPKLYQ